MPASGTRDVLIHGVGLGWIGSRLVPKARIPRPAHPYLAGATGPPPPLSGLTAAQTVTQQRICPLGTRYCFFFSIKDGAEVLVAGFV